MPPAEARLLDMLQGLIIKFDFKRWPDYIFLFKKEKNWIQYHKATKELWCRNSTIWSVIGNEFGLHYYEIQLILKQVAEKHFAIKGLTVYADDTSCNLIEEHFEMKDLKPCSAPNNDFFGVEGHFEKNQSFVF